MRALERRKGQIAQVAEVVRSSARDIERLLPEHIATATFLSAVGAALHKSAKLMEGAISDPDALLIALRESAMLGHIPGTDNYWLTPRKSRGRPSVLGIEGYQGIVERMFRGGGVLSVHAEIVRDGDTFVPYQGANGRPLHEFGGKRGAFSTRSERGEVIGVYGYAMLPGGFPSQLILLSIEDLMEIKAANPFSDNEDSPWRKWPMRMYLKSALRRLEPYVPMSAGYRTTAIQAQAFVAAQAPHAVAARMEDEAAAEAAAEVVEGSVEARQDHDREESSAPDRPVIDVEYDAAQWGGDPEWEGLSVAKPGQGVPPEVRGDA
jgi:recombination protein RecT